ncbi:MAG: hypothetical protein D8M58_21340 [Calditrichaeota bacterium]|nr:MAG: hypothetical protein DWQ03_00065 [Calditrichota bacterium]MBL1207958.1 hypothetical protein [Calditrichota bacterium]
MLKTDLYAELKKRVHAGRNVLILGYQATKYSSINDMDGKKLKKLCFSPSKRFVNAHILAGLLTNNHVWKE